MDSFDLVFLTLILIITFMVCVAIIVWWVWPQPPNYRSKLNVVYTTFENSSGSNVQIQNNKTNTYITTVGPFSTEVLVLRNGDFISVIDDNNQTRSYNIPFDVAKYKISYPL